ncbi:unnamed protein product [Dovyalis caffra]|uniref:Uncharacterized protein n=1 Tax=Dovyalis caffra TaxID=77055 RepID=A0AAV1RA54_9ROSI|nr:unnamed protein product [Dovyalis caffra]
MVKGSGWGEELDRFQVAGRRVIVGTMGFKGVVMVGAVRLLLEAWGWREGLSGCLAWSFGYRKVVSMNAREEEIEDGHGCWLFEERIAGLSWVAMTYLGFRFQPIRGKWQLQLVWQEGGYGCRCQLADCDEKFLCGRVAARQGWFWRLRGCEGCSGGDVFGEGVEDEDDGSVSYGGWCGRLDGVFGEGMCGEEDDGFVGKRREVQRRNERKAAEVATATVEVHRTGKDVVMSWWRVEFVARVEIRCEFDDEGLSVFCGFDNGELCVLNGCREFTVKGDWGGLMIWSAEATAMEFFINQKGLYGEGRLGWSYDMGLVGEAYVGFVVGEWLVGEDSVGEREAVVKEFDWSLVAELAAAVEMAASWELWSWKQLAFDDEPGF